MPAVVYSSGMEQTGGPKAKKFCRNVNIMADAAYAILIRDPNSYTGNLVFDEDILASEGVVNFDQYLADPS